MTLPRPRILIVDDEYDFRSILLLRLEHRGFSVAGAADAETALEMLRTERFAAVVLDNVLPGETGLASLPAIANRAGAPVIMMSGNTDPEVHQEALRSGARTFLVKPFEFEDLEKTIRGVLA